MVAHEMRVQFRLGDSCAGLPCKIRVCGRSVPLYMSGSSRPGPPMTASTTDRFKSDQAADLTRRRLAIGFLNWAHAIDHFVILIFPTVVIALVAVYGRSYADLIWLSTASFIAFGLFSLPAGWLADRWSRRNMMVAFYVGCGVSLLAAAAAPSL